MDASMANFRRCVIWFGEPTGQERASLTAAGWNIRVTAIDQPGDVGIRSDGTAVALADLRNVAAGSEQSLARLRKAYPLLPWLVVTGTDTATCLSRIDHFLQASTSVLKSPFDTSQLLAALSRIVDIRPKQVAKSESALIGGSPAMEAVLSEIHKYAPVDLPVLITGETGTGKEMAARALHRLSPRSEHPFEAINCGALPPNLVQSELFGHERGAFTGANVRRIGHFELAAGGTVFLDEVADLPRDAQTSLLRLLQEGTLERVGSSRATKLDVRVLAATHVDLDKAVALGHFREDLYYRLNVLRLRMPPLREHSGDVEPLAQHFLDAFLLRNRSCARGFEPSALSVLREHSWPGNVRELRNRVQRAAVVAAGAKIGTPDLDLPVVSANGAHPTLNLVRVAAERDTLVACLHDSSYNVSECARRLNVSRMTVYRLCKKHLLEMKRLRGNAG